MHPDPEALTVRLRKTADDSADDDMFLRTPAKVNMVVNITKEATAPSGTTYLYIDMRALSGWIKKEYLSDLQTPFEDANDDGSDADEHSDRDSASGTEDEDTFDVEAILDEKKEGRRLLYLVHWAGYSVDEATWEPRASLTYNTVFKEYLKCRSDAASPA